jgi:rhamnose utilization protein RhaD (predicted bifunctional aldolase and dehydrogenase)
MEIVSPNAGRVNPAVEQLLARSNRLGADARNTNYAGGNTSTKGTDVDPAFARRGIPG